MGRQFDQTGAITYDTTRDVEIVDRCFSIIATNLGDTIVRVNEMILFPSATPATDAGDAIELSGLSEGDTFASKKIRIKFQQPLGAAPLIEINQLYYLKEN